MEYQSGEEEEREEELLTSRSNSYHRTISYRPTRACAAGDRNERQQRQRLYRVVKGQRHRTNASVHLHSSAHEDKHDA